MATGIRWHGERAKRVVSQLALERMRRAAEETRDYAREKTSTPYPPAGPPGGYPHRRSGKFSGSIGYRVIRDRGSVHVISNDPKAKWLEFGTRFMAPRPTFRLILRYFGDRLQRAVRRRGSGAVR